MENGLRFHRNLNAKKIQARQANMLHWSDAEISDVKMDSLLKTLGDYSIAMIFDCKHMDVEKTHCIIYSVHIFCKVQSAGRRDIKNEEGNSKNGYHNVKCQVPETEDLEAAERKKRWKAERSKYLPIGHLILRSL